MSRMFGNSLMLVVSAALLGGCGLMQSVGESTRSMTRTVFYKQVKTLHLEFDGRVAMNRGVTETSGLSVPTLVRVYQLRDNETAQRATYELLLSDARSVLGVALLDERSVVVRPGAGTPLDVPLDEHAAVVVVVGLFREPDPLGTPWRLSLARDELEPDHPRVIEVGANRLTLRPRARE